MVLKSGYILTYYSHDGQEYINRLRCVQLFRDGNGLLIDLFNGWSTRRSRSVTLAWHATRHSARHTACLVHLGDDRSANALELLLLVLELFLLRRLVAIEPGNSFLAFLGDGGDLVGGDFILHLVVLDRLLHLEGVRSNSFL